VVTMAGSCAEPGLPADEETAALLQRSKPGLQESPVGGSLWDAAGPVISALLCLPVAMAS